jgi:ParB family chromosome partitioning protein
MNTDSNSSTNSAPKSKAAPRKALGRGLDALLGDNVAAPVASDKGPAQVAIADIDPGRYQPRRHFDPDELKALTESIREQGVLQPVLLRPQPEAPGRYELVAGERRWQAAQRAGLHEIPALVRKLDDSTTLEVALVENIQRQDLSPLEEAAGYQRLIDEFDHTQEALAKVVGKSRSHVANTLRLLGLPEAVKTMVDKGALSAGHARALLTAPHAAALAERIVREGLSVRQAEALAKAAPATASRPKRALEKSNDTLALEKRLAATLGLKVDIHQRQKGGDITFRFRSLDQLDELLDRLGLDDI